MKFGLCFPFDFYYNSATFMSPVLSLNVAAQLSVTKLLPFHWFQEPFFSCLTRQMILADYLGGLAGSGRNPFWDTVPYRARQTQQ